MRRSLCVVRADFETRQAVLEMLQRDQTRSRRSPLDRQRAYGAVRTALVSYGVAAFSYLFSQFTPDDTPLALGGTIPARSLVLLGLVLQLLLLAARALIKRHAPDHAAAVQGFLILELVGDGLTVLFFALGTFGAILHAAVDI
jgi:hypothetical protein